MNYPVARAKPGEVAAEVLACLQAAQDVGVWVTVRDLADVSGFNEGSVAHSVRALHTEGRLVRAERPREGLRPAVIYALTAPAPQAARPSP